MQAGDLQKQAAQAIINIFETGTVRGNYADVTLMRGDSGQLTYGRSQTTLASGNLFLLMKAYTERLDGAFCDAFKPFLTKLESCDSSLNFDQMFRGMLRDAGNDPIMHEVQDQFFDKVYWDPAIRSAQALGVKTGLGSAIVYDSTVHGSWARIRDRTRKKHGELADIGETKWIAHYVDERRDWLATHPNPLLHKCVYRMDAFKSLIHANNWDLKLPLNVRGLVISPDTISGAEPVKQSAEGMPRRLLRLKNPPFEGADVAWLQQRLTRAGYHVGSNGVFDEATQAAVRAFQESRDLKADGIVGAVTRSALEDLSLEAPPSNSPADEPMPAIAIMPVDGGQLILTAPVIAIDAGESGTVPPHVSNGIKDAVSSEVDAGVSRIQQAADEARHQIATAAADHAATIHASAPAQRHGIHLPSLKEMFHGRPVLATTASILMLGFTEARDALAWVQSGPFNSHQPVPTAGPAMKTLPETGSDLSRFLSETWVYLHGLAAAVPNEWIFRIRVAAVLLIIYVFYRLSRRHLGLKKIEERLAEARQIEADMSGVARALKPHA